MPKTKVPCNFATSARYKIINAKGNLRGTPSGMHKREKNEDVICFKKIIIIGMGRKKRTWAYRFAILGLKLGRNKVKMDSPMEHWHSTDYVA